MKNVTAFGFNNIALRSWATCIGLVMSVSLGSQAFGFGDDFPPGDSLQAWQDPRIDELLKTCKKPAKPFSVPKRPASSEAAKLVPPEAGSLAIDGVVDAGRKWSVVWTSPGNNTDGIIATKDGGIEFANNSASNVVRIDAKGVATVPHKNTNTGGALSRSKSGALYVISRGLHTSITQLEPTRKVLADSFMGDPLDCLGGIPNDLMADSKGGVYFTITFAGLYYADSHGKVSEFGQGMTLTNGIVLSADEKILYVTNGKDIVAFNVSPDGSLTNQHVFATLHEGAGDGSAIDSTGRLYVSTGSSVEIFAPSGEYLGTIPGVSGLHGVAFGGKDKKTLYAIVLQGTFTPQAKNYVMAMQMKSQGYLGRAK
jgi:gluconolactonase